ncbi:hypothetical protein F5Y04DRAFT_293172 [Hypomontagnella monticulosa]|nr:hypothetical protein F5Y04DRAFT_293172 [Hypomontagnella monticulosa]
MADPLSALGVGVGFVSLIVQLTDECIKGYKYFTEASQMAQGYWYLRVRMQMEQQRFLSFAAQATPLSKEGQLFFTLQIDQRLLTTVLLEVKTLLRKLQENEDRYGDTIQQPGLQWAEGNEPSIDILDILRLPCPKPDSGEKHTTRRLWKIGRYIIGTARKIQTVLGDPRRLVWASVGKEAFEALISKLSDLNSFLIALLDMSETRRILRKIEASNWETIQLREDMVKLMGKIGQQDRFQKSPELTGVKDRSLLDYTAAIGSENVGQRHLNGLSSHEFHRLEAKGLNTEDFPPRDTQSTVLILEFSKFSFPHKGLTDGQYERRTIAFLEEHSVWIEWVDFEPRAGATSSKTLRETRVSLLANTLHGSISRALGSPHCLGYVKSSNEFAGMKLGMAFEAPMGGTLESGFVTLRQILEVWHKPALPARLSLCSALADRISRFHSIGWLHKGLKSDNILFFGQNISEKSLGVPYMSGFDLSRPAENVDMTEPITIDPWSDIYRHPHAQFGEAKATYRKSYDIYSFGVILIEIAMWQPIEVILGIENLAEMKQGELRGVHGRLLGGSARIYGAESRDTDYLANIANDCGMAYRDIVEICLEADNVERPLYRGEPQFAISARVCLMFEQVAERLAQMNEALGHNHGYTSMVDGLGNSYC